MVGGPGENIPAQAPIEGTGVGSESAVRPGNAAPDESQTPSPDEGGAVARAAEKPGEQSARGEDSVPDETSASPPREMGREERVSGWATEAPPLPDFRDPINPVVDPKRVTMLSDVNLRVKIELGRTQMLVEDVLKLGDGSVVELDKLAGDPLDVFVNNRLVARGEVLVLNDNFCVRISEVLANDPHRIAT